MGRLLLLVALSVGGYLVWQWMPDAEQRAAYAKEHQEGMEQREKRERADYQARHLPEGCEIRQLPKFQDVEKIVLVRCEAASVTVANTQWEENKTVNCGKVLCTQTEVNNSATILIE